MSTKEFIYCLAFILYAVFLSKCFNLLVPIPNLSYISNHLLPEYCISNLLPTFSSSACHSHFYVKPVSATSYHLGHISSCSSLTDTWFQLQRPHHCSSNIPVLFMPLLFPPSGQSDSKIFI